MATPDKFPAWKTIKLGTYRSVSDLLNALTAGGFQMSYFAEEVVQKISLANAGVEIDLVRVTVAELGFEGPARHDAIYDRARESGLDLLPAEAGPQLRLQYTDEPENEWTVVAMEPVIDSTDTISIFRVVRHSSGLWLETTPGDPRLEWHPEDRWVFGRRR